MHTHKFECPAKNLTLDKGNYGESAQIYVNMQSSMNTYNIIHTHVDMCTYKTWLHNLEWPVTILTEHKFNYGKLAHFQNPICIQCEVNANT